MKVFINFFVGASGKTVKKKGAQVLVFWTGYTSFSCLIILRHSHIKPEEQK
jgi:hypothetical protein